MEWKERIITLKLAALVPKIFINILHRTCFVLIIEPSEHLDCHHQTVNTYQSISWFICNINSSPFPSISSQFLILHLSDHFSRELDDSIKNMTISPYFTAISSIYLSYDHVLEQSCWFTILKSSISGSVSISWKPFILNVII